MAEGNVRIEAARLEAITRRIMEAAGATPSNAQAMARSLVAANLAGHDSHGVMRVPGYIAAIRAGELLPAAIPAVERETAAGALVNGNWTFGQVSCAFATDVAIARARERMASVVGLVRCHHSGRLGEYAEQATAAGVILLVFGGGLAGSPLVAPFGGSRAALGANPIAAGFPADAEHGPFIMDFATTVVAEGKVRVARDSGKLLPPGAIVPGAIVDREGRPSVDPNDFYAGGMLLPFGGHKGYALSLFAELLITALLGAGDWAEDGRGGRTFGRSGVLFLAIDPRMFDAADGVERRAAETLANMTAVPPAPGFGRVMTPGEPERQTAAERGRAGIPLPMTTWESLRAIAEEYGLEIDTP
jgi:LDH2 family malate/lactate/ureidoglycolate dehydrogenase